MKRSILAVLLLLASTLTWATNESRFPQEDNSLRVLSYNIRSGLGLDDVRDLDRTAQVINSISPAVVALQEVDSVTSRVDNRDIIAELGAKTAMYTVYGSAIDYAGGKYGVALLSKERPLNHKNIPLPGREEKRTLLVVEFDNYVVMSTHWSLNAKDRLSSVEIVNQTAKHYDKPIYLVGDLNAEPDSDEINLLKKNWKILNNTKQATFPANDPTNHIDYIMGYTGKEQLYSVLRAQVVNEPVVSDHRPLFVDVRVPAAADKVMRTVPYLQNPATDAMTVMWLTNVPCRSWVEYGTDPNNLTRARSFIEGMMVANNKINRIRIEHLKPNTTYYYRVVSQEIVRYMPYSKEFGDTIYSDMSTFKTINPDAEDFTVVVYNDLHRNHGLMTKFSKLLSDIDYDLVIYNGDCLDDVNFEEDAVSTINHYSKAMKSDQVPSIYLRGNHETRGAYSTFLWDLLDRMGGESSYTAFSLGDTRFMLLDCGEDKVDDHWVYYDMNDFTQYRQEQVEFIKDELSRREFKKAKKRVLIHHIPLFGEGMKSEYNPCKELWESALAKGKFDLALNAHIHKYEYLESGADGNNYPVIIGGGPNEASATVALVEKRSGKLSVRVLSPEGDEILKLDL